MRYDDSRMSEAIAIGVSTLEVMFCWGIPGSAIPVAAVEDTKTVPSSGGADSTNENDTQN
jgi:hypothetical protein